MVPSIGRIVLVNIGRNTASAHDTETHHWRPALVVRVWGTTPEAAINVHLFLDDFNDAGCEYLLDNKIDALVPNVYRTSLIPGEGVGNWKWPPRV